MRGDSSIGGSDRALLIMALVALTIPAALFINRTVPSAYLDEEFHVRQVQHYCGGDFEYWDPKITTFPGLYIISLAYIRALLPLGQILGLGYSVEDLCQPAVLRSVNVVLSFICALLFREILLHLDPDKDKMGASVKALVLSLYPLHWFFNFLYYTELGSATAVMAMYLASLKHAYWSSALFGAISILFRQTNAVWVLFVLCVGILDFLQIDVDRSTKARLEDDGLFPVEGQDKGHMSTSGKRAVEGGSALNSSAEEDFRKDGLRKRQSIRRAALSPEDSHDSMQMVSRKLAYSLLNQDIFFKIKALMKGAWLRKHEIIWNFGPLLLVSLAFVGFVLHNGSIVVGDKSAHKVSPHFAQLLYCGLVSAGFQAALLINPQNLSYQLWVLKTSTRKKSVACCFVATVAAFIAVRNFSSPHPYLLADNRHYVFYVWKDVFQRHLITKYLLIPLYLFSWWSIILMLGKKESELWVVAFCLAVAGVLVPTPLLEFRYYNVPFYFMFLHSCQNIPHEKYTLALTALKFQAVNIATVYIFLFWPFAWPSEPGKLQRFLW